MNKTSNHDLKTFKADILLLSEKGLRARVLKKPEENKDWKLVWLPQSQIVIGKDEIEIPVWLALEKGLM